MCHSCARATVAAHPHGSCHENARPPVARVVRLDAPALARGSNDRIRIERASDRPSSATGARVSVYSDVTAENKRGVSVAEATSILAAAKGTGSSVLVGVVVSDHVGLSEYSPSWKPSRRTRGSPWPSSTTMARLIPLPTTCGSESREHANARKASEYA